jgi:cytochrome P450
MTETPQPRPVFLRRDGVLPAAQLRQASGGGGLARTTTVFGQEAWLVAGHADVREVLSDPGGSRSKTAPRSCAPMTLIGGSSPEACCSLIRLARRDPRRADCLPFTRVGPAARAVS